MGTAGKNLCVLIDQLCSESQLQSLHFTFWYTEKKCNKLQCMILFKTKATTSLQIYVKQILFVWVSDNSYIGTIADHVLHLCFLNIPGIHFYLHMWPAKCSSSWQTMFKYTNLIRIVQIANLMLKLTCPTCANVYISSLRTDS